MATPTSMAALDGVSVPRSKVPFGLTHEEMSMAIGGLILCGTTDITCPSVCTVVVIGITAGSQIKGGMVFRTARQAAIGPVLATFCTAADAICMAASPAGSLAVQGLYGQVSRVPGLRSFFTDAFDCSGGRLQKGIVSPSGAVVLPFL